MKPTNALIDSRVYYVTGINGYRSAWMGQEQANAAADRMIEQMKIAGWSGKVRVHYRDGSVVRQIDA